MFGSKTSMASLEQATHRKREAFFPTRYYYLLSCRNFIESFRQKNIMQALRTQPLETAIELISVRRKLLMPLIVLLQKSRNQEAVGTF